MASHITSPLTFFTREVLSGFGQVMLQPSPYVGAAFLVGVVMNSYLLALFGLSGCVAGVILALVLRFPSEERSSGLYGFNGTLMGLSLGYFFEMSWLLLVLVILGGMLSSVVMFLMLRQKFRPLTFPFVIVAWGVMLMISATEWASPVKESVSTPNIQLIGGIARGYGQVLFQESIITGMIFIAVITVRNRTEGAFATLGSMLGLLVGYIADFPLNALNYGLFGYNGVLCGILFAGWARRDIASALVAILLSVAFVHITIVAGIPTLTFPFVLASWLVLWGRASYL